MAGVRVAPGTGGIESVEVALGGSRSVGVILGIGISGVRVALGGGAGDGVGWQATPSNAHDAIRMTRKKV
jgi:hypothetical protein